MKIGTLASNSRGRENMSVKTVTLETAKALKETRRCHHIDGNKQNNNIDNLMVIEHGKHAYISNISRVHKKGYRLNITQESRIARSKRAKKQELYKHGQAVLAKMRLAKATGKEANGHDS